jgi:ABC-type phosphate transport system auxiliary subunit
MNTPVIVLLVCLTIIAITVLYISTRYRLSTCELRRTLDQVLASIRAIETTVKRDRHVLNDAHKQISSVTKALQKPTR